MSFQKVLILGNAGKDAEVRRLDGGNIVASFPIATSEVYKDKNGNRQERTEWHSIDCWGRLAEFAEKYVKKGSSFFIEGRIRTQEYTGKDGQKKSATRIQADSIQFAGGKKDDSGNTQASAPSQSNNPYNPNDLPF